MSVDSGICSLSLCFFCFCASFNFQRTFVGVTLFCTWLLIAFTRRIMVKFLSVVELLWSGGVRKLDNRQWGRPFCGTQKRCWAPFWPHTQTCQCGFVVLCSLWCRPVMRRGDLPKLADKRKMRREICGFRTGNWKRWATKVRERKRGREREREREERGRETGRERDEGEDVCCAWMEEVEGCRTQRERERERERERDKGRKRRHS